MSEQWKLVPKEPTQEMIDNTAFFGGIDNARITYIAMLAAAPTQGADGHLPALPKALWTVGEVGAFTEHQMQGYANSALALNRTDDVRSATIHQSRLHTDDENTWSDCYEATFYACKAYPDKYATRIVFATCDAAPSNSLTGFGILPDDCAAFARFHATCEDREGHDVPKITMERLAYLGLLQKIRGSTYEFTKFGLVMQDRLLAASAPKEATPRPAQVERSPTRCTAARDGECFHAQCPQLLDGEPEKSGRHCPLDTGRDDD